MVRKRYGVEVRQVTYAKKGVPILLITSIIVIDSSIITLLVF